MTRRETVSRFENSTIDRSRLDSIKILWTRGEKVERYCRKINSRVSRRMKLNEEGKEEEEKKSLRSLRKSR
jgi:hypothetical protein